jgi:hypothetical protein
MKHVIMLCLLLGIMYSVQATRIEWGKNPVINKPVYEDLYIAGGDIIINAPVYGDLIIAGGTITINDTVYNDILVAGGTVSFNGYAGDDIRCAGGKLNILKNVAGDVVATGGTIVIDKGATIGSLISAGGEVTLDGSVTGMVKNASGKLLLNGNVMKDIDCRGGNITINGTIHGHSVIAASDEIIIGDAAGFGNGVRYWVPGRRIDFKQSVKGGQVVYDPSLRMDSKQWYYLGFASFLGLLWYVGMALLMIMIVQYLFSATMKKAGQTAFDKALKSLGYGLLFLIAVPIAAVVAFITIIGVPIGIILLFSYVVLALLGTVIISVVAANWLNNRSNTNWRYWRMVFVALGIFIVFKILSGIPYLGWFIMGLLVCIAFGAILQNVNWRQRTVRISA